MRLHIVRHGQTDWNAVRRIQGQLDSQLDDIGKQQAIDRGADFKHMKLNAVYSSSSLRTRQTTRLILGERKDLVTYRDDLREVHLGIWQGQYWADIEATYPDLVHLHATHSPDFDVEGAEKSADVQLRGVAAIESIIMAHKNAKATDNILIVSHGAIMKTILAHYTGLALSHLQAMPTLPNCAHCIISVDKRKRTVELVAGTPIDDTPWAKAPQEEWISQKTLQSLQPAIER